MDCSKEGGDPAYWSRSRLDLVRRLARPMPVSDPAPILPVRLRCLTTSKPKSYGRKGPSTTARISSCGGGRARRLGSRRQAARRNASAVDWAWPRWSRSSHSPQPLYSADRPQAISPDSSRRDMCARALDRSQAVASPVSPVRTGFRSTSSNAASRRPGCKSANIETSSPL